MTRYAPPTYCLRRLKDPSYSATQHRKLDVRQIIFNKYCKIISLMTLKCQKALISWEKLVTFLRHKTLRGLILWQNCGSVQVLYILYLNVY